MFNFKRYLFLCIFGCFFNLNSVSYGQDIICETLEKCDDVVSATLNSRATRDNGVNYYDISTAYAKFGQAGFDALFDKMLRSGGDDQTALVAALSHLKKDSYESLSFQISKSQYNRLIAIWSHSPGYSLAGLINHADTPASHAFMIKALQIEDKKRRYWAEQVIAVEGFGNGKSSVSKEHLNDILKLIKANKYAALVSVLPRIDTVEADTALWSLLRDNDESVFYESFEILEDKDPARVYETLKAQSFLDTPEDNLRALMIAEVLRRKYLKSGLNEKNYYFWINWYDAAETSETERLIPAYQLFHLFEKTKKRVDGADKFIEDRQQWKGFTLANPKGRTGHLSVEYLDREISDKRAEVARLMPFLQIQTSRLLRDEGRTLADYFRIFEARRLSSHENIYVYGQGDYLPLPVLLDAVVQTPKRWAARFWTYIQDEAFEENTAIVERITALETDEEKLKKFYLERLSYKDNIPKLLSTLAAIANHDTLRKDRDVREAVKSVTQNPEFTAISVAADYAISDIAPPEGFGIQFYRGWIEPYDDIMQNAHAKRKYCEPSSSGEADYLTVPPEFNRPLIEPHNQLGVAKMVIKTPSGYLAGHNRGEFGGGLLYYTDVTAEGELLRLSYSRNIIAIVESETEGVYWALAGLNHMISGKGAIYEVDARTDNVTVKPHKRMLAVPRDTTFLKNGDLFMDFRARSYTTLDMKNGGVEKVHTLPDEKYNPPVILTRIGELKKACED